MLLKCITTIKCTYKDTEGPPGKGRFPDLKKRPLLDFFLKKTSLGVKKIFSKKNRPLLGGPSVHTFLSHF